MIFFTADTHFFHKSILTEKFENRPFETVEEMNEKIIHNWNTIVKDKDEVYILGDVSFGRRQETTDIIKSLKGRKYLILGNHDDLNVEQKELFEWTKHYYKLRIENQRYILFHNPIFAWDGKEKGHIHLHGHVHNNSHHDIILPNKINVGMDLWNFTPVSIDQILERREIIK